MLTRSYLFVPADRPERFAKARPAAPMPSSSTSRTRSRRRQATARAALAAGCTPAHGRCWCASTPSNRVVRDDLAMAARPGHGRRDAAQGRARRRHGRVRAAIRRRSVADDRDRSGLANALAKSARASACSDWCSARSISSSTWASWRWRRAAALPLAARAGVAAGAASRRRSTAYRPPSTMMIALHADTLRARRLGFGAKLCIHPRQVPVVNDAFRPTAERDRVGAARCRRRGACRRRCICGRWKNGR